jgi:glutamate dehydrogenase
MAQLVGQVGDRSPCPGADRFLQRFYADVAPDDLLDRDADDLVDIALGHLNFARYRKPGLSLVRVVHPRNPDGDISLNQCVVQVVTDNMPFLVDSVRIAINQRGLNIDRTIHPVTRVVRDPSGDLVEVLDKDGLNKENALSESYLYIEASSDSSVEPISEVENAVRSTLIDVSAAVEDWQLMRHKIETIKELIAQQTLPLPREDVEETQCFLQWLVDDNFTFLGYREYELVDKDGEDILRILPGTGLGILRQRGAEQVSSAFSVLPSEVRKRAREPQLLILTKGNSRSTVHLPTYIDYVGIKRFSETGQVTGEYRLLGLYTSVAYRCDPYEIPVVRRKLKQIITRSGYERGSHAEKSLETILQTYPRDELFQISPELLFEIAMGIVRLHDRQRVRLFMRRDPYARFVSCLVFVARDRYDTKLRHRFENVLLEAFSGDNVECNVLLSESVLARLHFVIRGTPGRLSEVDDTELEQKLADAARIWSEQLAGTLSTKHASRSAIVLARRYRDAFPVGYQDTSAAAEAADDIEQMEKLDGGDNPSIRTYRLADDSPDTLRLKLYQLNDPIPLSEVIPVLENLALFVKTERPHRITRSDGSVVWMHDFGTVHKEKRTLSLQGLRINFQEAFVRTWAGEAENDGFNQLILGAKLSWREAAVLRAYCRYLLQLRVPFSQTYMEKTLASNTDIAMLLIDYFNTRFDPALRDRSFLLESHDQDIMNRIHEVSSLDEDRILRLYLSALQATLRTNYFQITGDDEPKPYLTLKIDPEQIDAVPEPRPKFEIFVYSPRVEGVHLRGGKVARGGIRWSDRREDFRTEVLGLMKAQMVKNAVIVPVGAKGGFVLRGAPPDDDRLKEEVQQCYRTFIQGLLDVTDNLVEGKPVAPASTVCYDDADPYLVVAADKGTATFSDVANDISESNRFWLGDAFASGGSAGYDHKKMGITARGAWESVKRHFRELSTDIQTTPFTVVGIGDMAGDVFGNGMLLSPCIRLVAAFNHLHIFIDPDPDPQTGFQERKRLFELPRSTWLDYNKELITKGGGIFSRASKSIQLSPQMRELLGTNAESLNPNELIRCVLKARADLLWNGGIGTFVKSSFESHADVGDRVTDSIRVNADELRCKVVGEGGNLGLTQLGRIEFAKRGGYVITDSIDNSGGVDSSDHEVNIKILLTGPVSTGELSVEDRNRLLARMTEELVDLVLTHNYQQTQAISIASHQAVEKLEDHARLIRRLEREGRLKRRLEFLPNDDDITERGSGGMGLTRPELAILFSYVKIALFTDLLSSDVPEDPYVSKELQRYFPTPLRNHYHAYMDSHPLRREIIATHITNSMINSVDLTMISRYTEQYGYSAADITRAYVAARDIFDLMRYREDVDALDNEVPSETQIDMLIKMRRLIERATFWLLQNQPQPLDIAGSVNTFSDGVKHIAHHLHDWVAPAHRDVLDRAVQDYLDVGVPLALAQRCSGLGALYSALDIVEVSAGSSFDVDDVVRIYFELGHRLSMYWLREQLLNISPGHHWQRMATDGLYLDLYRYQRLVSSKVVEGSAKSKHVDYWMSHYKQEVDRIDKTVVELKEQGAPDLAMLMVAIREIQALAE